MSCLAILCKPVVENRKAALQRSADWKKSSNNLWQNAVVKKLRLRQTSCRGADIHKKEVLIYLAPGLPAMTCMMHVIIPAQQPAIPLLCVCRQGTEVQPDLMHHSELQEIWNEACPPSGEALLLLSQLPYWYPGPQSLLSPQSACNAAKGFSLKLTNVPLGFYD